MPRYIDAYKLYSRLIDAKHLFCKNQLEFRALPPNDKARVDEIDNLISIVINFPTADVVEVVRCKDCAFCEDPRYRGNAKVDDHIKFCCQGMEPFLVHDDYFCASGMTPEEINE